MSDEEKLDSNPGVSEAQINRLQKEVENRNEEIERLKAENAEYCKQISQYRAAETNTNFNPQQTVRQLESTIISLQQQAQERDQQLEATKCNIRELEDANDTAIAQTGHVRQWLSNHGKMP